MVGPARKREAVSHLQRGWEMSQRRACQVVGQPRATQRYVPEPEAEEERLRARLRAFSRERPRAGYRTACGQLRQEGLRVNPKRVQRLWREEGLKVPRRQGKKRRLGATNLMSPIAWQTISTNTAGTNGLFSFTDTNTSGQKIKFYRISTP